MAGIICSDYFIPNDYIEVKDLVDSLQLSNDEKRNKIQYFDRCSIKKINVWKSDNVIETLKNLLEEMIIQNSIDVEKISYIAFGNYKYFKTNDNVNIPYYLKEKFGMKNASIFFIDQICASSVYSIGLLNSILSNEPEKLALIITINIMEDTERFRNFTIAGDGCAIALIGEEQCNYKVVDFYSEAYGKYSYFRKENIQNNITDLQIASVAAKIIKKIISKNNLGLRNIKQLIAQNTNLMQLEILAKLLKIPLEIVFTKNISCGGHAGDVDTMRNFKDYTDELTIKENEVLLLYSSGLYPTDDIIFSILLIRKGF